MLVYSIVWGAACLFVYEFSCRQTLLYSPGPAHGRIRFDLMCLPANRIYQYSVVYSRIGKIPDCTSCIKASLVVPEICHRFYSTWHCRSLLGDRDSEFGVYIKDTEYTAGKWTTELYKKVSNFSSRWIFTILNSFHSFSLSCNIANYSPVRLHFFIIA